MPLRLATVFSSDRLGRVEVVADRRLADQPGAVGHQHPQRDRLVARLVRGLEVGQVLRHRGVEVELALLDELHHGDVGEQLRHASRRGRPSRRWRGSSSRGPGSRTPRPRRPSGRRPARSRGPGSFLSSTSCLMSFSSSATAALYGSAGGTAGWRESGGGEDDQTAEDGEWRMACPRRMRASQPVRGSEQAANADPTCTSFGSILQQRERVDARGVERAVLRHEQRHVDVQRRERAVGQLVEAVASTASACRPCPGGSRTSPGSCTPSTPWSRHLLRRRVVADEVVQVARAEPRLVVDPHQGVHLAVVPDDQRPARVEVLPLDHAAEVRDRHLRPVGREVDAEQASSRTCG